MPPVWRILAVSSHGPDGGAGMSLNGSPKSAASCSGSGSTQDPAHPPASAIDVDCRQELPLWSSAASSWVELTTTPQPSVTLAEPDTDSAARWLG